MDIAVDRLDGEADHAAERISALEDKMVDVEQGLDGLLTLGQEQTKTSTWAVWGLGQLATAVLAQQAKIRSMEEHIVIVTVAYTTIAQLFSFIFAKSNSFPTLVDLIFPFILSIHVILILSYPYIFTFTLTRPLSFLPKCAGYFRTL